MIFFYFLKIIFEISTSKRSKTYKKINFLQKKINFFWERGCLHRVPKQTRMSSKNHGQYGKTLNTVQSICLLEIIFVWKYNNSCSSKYFLLKNI